MSELFPTSYPGYRVWEHVTYLLSRFTRAYPTDKLQLSHFHHISTVPPRQPANYRRLTSAQPAIGPGTIAPSAKETGTKSKFPSGNQYLTLNNI